MQLPTHSNKHEVRHKATLKKLLEIKSSLLDGDGCIIFL